MKLEQNEKSYLFSSTEIPDVFFSEYLSDAKGDYIKVYLYMLFLSKHGKDIKQNDLSKKLALPFPVIQEAIAYWEGNGVFIKKSIGYVLCDLQEKQLLALYKPRLSSSPEQAQKTEESKYRAHAIDTINNQYFNGVMSPTWYPEIDLWFKKYGFDEQVMISLFGYCYEKSALHRNYVRVVADSWNKNNIKTYTDLENYYQKQEKLGLFKKNISKKLGLNRLLTQFEEAYVEKWVVDFGFSQGIIDVALKKTTSKTNPSFDYLDKLLTDWNERGFKTPEEATDFVKKIKEQNKTTKTLDKKSGGQNNYARRDYSSLDSLYSNN